MSDNELILTDEQRVIVESPEDKIVVIAAAAVGKTRTLIERIRWILKKGVLPAEIVCITFTNNSAAEIKIRLGEDYKDGMFIGTVHGYANYLLSQGGVDTKSLRDSEKFDELFEEVMKHPNVVQQVSFLALDEAQDSSSSQFEFIFDMISPKAFIIFGDVRQSIYGFNGANPKLILSLAREDGVTVYDMVENHRNSAEVILYSNSIVDRMKSIPRTHVVGMRSEVGLVKKTAESTIVKLIKANGNSYGDWAILCRTNKRIYEIMARLKASGIPAITFRQAQGSSSDLSAKMGENSVKVLTVHSSKGLQWPKVIVADQNWSSEENLRLMYVAVTRTMDDLYMVQGR